MRLTVDIAMTQSTVEEQVTVVAKSPTVDVKSTRNGLGHPDQRNPAEHPLQPVHLRHRQPGARRHDDVAYGASEGTGIAYPMDGVNVADPEGGTAWVFLDYNIIEEAKVMGVGLPAEYGNFTGVIFNLITKSGGNSFSGHMEVDFQGKKGRLARRGLWQHGQQHAYVADFPDLTSPLSSLRRQRPPGRPDQEGQTLVLRGPAVVPDSTD